MRCLSAFPTLSLRARAFQLKGQNLGIEKKKCFFVPQILGSLSPGLLLFIHVACLVTCSERSLHSRSRLPSQITFWEAPFLLLDKAQSLHLLSPEYSGLHFSLRLEVLCLLLQQSCNRWDCSPRPGCLDMHSTLPHQSVSWLQEEEMGHGHASHLWALAPVSSPREAASSLIFREYCCRVSVCLFTQILEISMESLCV